MKRPLLALLLCSIGLAAQADPARVIRATELKAQPYSDTTTVMPLAQNAVVQVLSRQGGWYRVKAQDKEGWVRMTALRLGEAGRSSGDSGFGLARRFFSTGRSGSSGVTVATGVRGLDAADITNAKPDARAVEGMDRLAVSAEEARRYAAEQQLSAQKIAHLSAPQQAAH